MTDDVETASSKKRQAKISTSDEEPVGVAIFLSSEQLRALGIKPAEADEVTYYVDTETERVVIESADAESEK